MVAIKEVLLPPQSRSGQVRYLAENLSGGTWAAATPPLPAAATTTRKPGPQQDSTALDSVTCQAADSCVAVGTYTAGSGPVDGTIETLSGRSWTAAAAPLPRGAATTGQDAYFRRVVCPAPGNCVAVGGYAHNAGQDTIELALIETATDKHG